MRRTIFISGTNSGIGKAIVEFFASKGWNVAATVRNVDEYPNLFASFPNVRLYSLEMTDYQQIENIVKQVISDFKRVDVVVNNAAYCLIGPLETTSMEQLKNQYETNVFGVYATIKAFLPHLRENSKGTIINIASSSAQFNFPFISGYGSTKWAIRGITESLGIELAPFNIQVKAIYPGTHATGIFTKLDHGTNALNDAYRAYKPSYRNFISAQKIYPKATAPESAAKEIWRAVAMGTKGKLHFVTGGDAKFQALMKKILPQRSFQKMQIGLIDKPTKESSRGFIKWLFGKNVQEVKTDIPQSLLS
ncbi:SDR family oxidoreductase [Tunicatimonas pelagia]|uniref:SDR family oxidoreductase n=1 Tax=Tunicatimonas pelagia TaxID=931531 RepID=UPI00266575CA|nr:SDR family oxidoreductase [Tunicatimonas pelagia]WKN44136.1 SDR family oxidoreductase [Tunicatimonas pelagia]